jgi:hypothetical protein
MRRSIEALKKLIWRRIPVLDKRNIGLFRRALTNVFSPKQGVAEMNRPPGFNN